MDLLEYQAKELFAQVGIPILPSQPIYHPGEVKNLQLPYPIVIKSQVLASGRTQFGGVRFVENTIDAIAVARSLFNLAIEGEYPQVLLAESHCRVDRELFVGIMWDNTIGRPLLLASGRGGVEVESLLANLESFPIEDSFSPFQARILAKKIGLTGRAMASVADVFTKMYQLFVTYDLDIVEINPLGLRENGEVIALDGKIRLNHYALQRHPELHKYLKNGYDRPYTVFILNPENNPEKDIAIVSDSRDEAILLGNLLQQGNNNSPIHSLYLLPRKTAVYWQENVNPLISQIMAQKSLKKVLVVHSNLDSFVDILTQQLALREQELSKSELRELTKLEQSHPPSWIIRTLYPLPHKPPQFHWCDSLQQVLELAMEL
ncbi:MAG: acetate--CoA ligase family protein [Geminocystis sp.]|nr:acetate--CoA ligase family protein [Geminocystis sp.]HIK37893.1 acetate--CoA ligase family protein [Geminocystis sp. M7585_C2015_104]MCS7146995.1 acetate--CoA ligase family protein [Geminocystis sp.]MCX8077307.1 acetate--CoA ligase family protein [Geminocystis sp.]MDW8115819.1 ATP-grasp domain-containing protein [Geminocystis sp.]